MSPYFWWYKSNFGGPCHQAWPDYEGSWAESPPTSKLLHSGICNKNILTGKQVCLHLSTFYSTQSTVLQYITLPHHVYRVLQGVNAPFAAKVVVERWNIPWLLILRCFSAVDDAVYTVKYCKKKKQTDDNLWLYFSRMTRRPSGGGRQRLFTQQQELAIVRADNAIRFHQLQQKILADRQVFNNINHVSIITIRRILGKHNITMKQLYRVPFERNSVRVKGLRREYVQVSVTVLYIYNTVLVKSSSSWMCTISVPHGSIRRATQVPVWWGGGSVCVAL